MELMVRVAENHAVTVKIQNVTLKLEFALMAVKQVIMEIHARNLAQMVGMVMDASTNVAIAQSATFVIRSLVSVNLVVCLALKGQHVMTHVLITIMAKTVICHADIVGKENTVILKMEPVMMDVRQVIWETYAGQNVRMVIMEKIVT